MLSVIKKAYRGVPQFRTKTALHSTSPEVWNTFSCSSDYAYTGNTYMISFQEKIEANLEFELRAELNLASWTKPKSSAAPVMHLNRSLLMHLQEHVGMILISTSPKSSNKIKSQFQMVNAKYSHLGWEIIPNEILQRWALSLVKIRPRWSLNLRSNNALKCLLNWALKFKAEWAIKWLADEFKISGRKKSPD